MSSTEALEVTCPRCQKEIGEHYTYVPAQCSGCNATIDIVPNQFEADQRSRAFHGKVKKQGERWLVSYSLMTT